ncbi:hypothetical protein Lqui_2826 [Legionella quinlivanii]|uniref:Dot/Icm T4SS effector n=1 Tax=Legionella quinlivanii TaxID=45073 RepID=A0A0W0XLE5_9GAMM|nr:hypothetical protein [Legionella quinlivanii]KTD45355.1 hypothetical protein Lqui_2826 [Legionella quinlivanii]SEG15176.1 hypothetical protein SAMN02746093_02007 [Legionella quinlivanii DSM 21216]STY10389.1 Uncharacterised protein [Legionella quinlivanii]
MTKKVALVDIDGCLVQNGKLNKALAERLKNHDQIILFTQRSRFLQITQLPAHILNPVPGHDIDSTCDAVKQLTEYLGKKVLVSTSVDLYFGNPTEYYNNVLADFETRLADDLRKNDIEFNMAGFNDEVREECSIIKQALNIPDDLNVSPSSYYPEGKTDQYKHLVEGLSVLLDTDEQIEIDYFDDRPENFKEILREQNLSIRPNCQLVLPSYIVPFDTYKQHFSVPENEKANTVNLVHRLDTIQNLKQYKINRDLEQQQQKSDFHGKWASFFKRDHANANIKISAANKAIAILSGGEGIDISLNELKALKDKRLQVALGEFITEIEDYYNASQDSSKKLSQ